MLYDITPEGKKKHVGVLDRLIQLVDKIEGVTTHIEADRILKAWYDTAFNIYDHVRSKPKTGEFPASILLHAAEDISRLSPRRISMREFARSSIFEIFGLNYEQFTNMPTYECQLMAEEATSEKKRRNKHLEDIKKGLMGNTPPSDGKS